MAGRSSRRRTSTPWRRGRCGSRGTTSARCPACRRGTTSCAARSTSCGSPGARWRSGRTPSPRACATPGVVTPADQRPPAPVRDRRRELPRRLHRLGLPARPRGRRLEDAARSQLGRRAVVRPRAACPTTTRAAGSAARRTSRARAPWRPRARWLEENAGAHERFFLFVDEFDPHEPFDTPEPYASLYDPDWGGPHLIWPPYVVGAREKGILDERQARQVAGQLRRQADDDRLLARPGTGHAGQQRPVGRHPGHSLHRPRPLPGREGHLGKAGRAALSDHRPYPAADGRPRDGGRRLRSPDHQRRPLRHPRSNLRSGPGSPAHPRRSRCCRC